MRPVNILLLLILGAAVLLTVCLTRSKKNVNVLMEIQANDSVEHERNMAQD